MQKVKGYIGIFLFLLVIIGIYFWEVYGREQLLYSNVYVTSVDLFPGDALTFDKVTLVKLEQERLIKNFVSSDKDLLSIIGYEAKHYIPANSQIVKDFFDIPEIVLNDNEYICPVPPDWVLAFPQSLRRKDTVSIFAVLSTIDKDKAKNYTVEEIINMIKGKEPLFNTIVAYVKDGSNREVIDVKESGERMDASSKISTIELVMDADKFEILNNLYEIGYKFIIMYK